ncbi:TIGR04282 family arsenosugar biosynthesis glycosyltransferase [Leeuwenhoekiella sp. W20_SRS_FM14]|uniref:TIGR04282 family arsenosugar biosynthesis glycosyltransferase n=1 Tax=Leeuwenhoekiella sp. W20_SRS_FM14 TaxID=3240270 RepID=UPI003F951DE4
MQVFDALNKHAVKTVKKTGLPYFIYSEEKQIGSNFGERFTQAIQEIYALGFENIITIGNDSPHLTATHILEANQHLKENPIVLGPSADGGFYLMGLKKSHFNPDSFLKLPWQTEALTSSILRLVHAKKIEAILLDRLQDLDSVADIEALLQSQKSLHYTIGQLLLNALEKSFSLPLIQPFWVETFHASNYFNKGSPVLFSA